MDALHKAVPPILYRDSYTVCTAVLMKKSH